MPAVRVNISLPDEMVAELKNHLTINVSQVCQSALRAVLDREDKSQTLQWLKDENKRLRGLLARIRKLSEE